MGTTLTQTKINGAKPKKSNAYYIWDKNGERGSGVLGVKITPSGNKLYYFRYIVGGKSKFIKLGSVSGMSLKTAREHRVELSALLASGIDPKEKMENDKRKAEEERRRQQAHGTFADLLNVFFEHLSSKHKDPEQRKRCLSRYERHVKYYIEGQIAPERKVNTITKQDILALLGKITPSAPVQADKIRSILHKMFELAIDFDDDPANYQKNLRFFTQVNPVSRIKKQNKSKPGRRSLSLHEIQRFMDPNNEKYFDKRIFLLLKMSIFLGGQRPFELLLSKRSSFIGSNDMLVLEDNCTKTSVANVLPIGQNVQSMIDEVDSLRFIDEAHNPLLFSASNTMGHVDPSYVAKQLRKFCETTGFPKFTPRDLRRSVKNIMLELDIRRDITNYIQNHSFGDVAEAHYITYEFMTQKKIALSLLESKLTEIPPAKAN